MGRVVATIEQAIELAVKHHKGQVDKAGQPYILHPLRLMQNMKNEIDQIVAVLHDIVEDTPVTLEELKERGFSLDIVNAVDCLTKRENESYNQFIDRVCEDAIASRVKLADLEDNMDLSRLAEIKEEDRARLEKYQSAHDKITNSTRTCSGCGNPPIYCDCHEYV